MRRVVSRICPHEGGDISKGYVENGRIRCPWHHMSFDPSPDNPPALGVPRCACATMAPNERLRGQQCFQAPLRRELLAPSENVRLRNHDALKQSFAPKPPLYIECVVPGDHGQVEGSCHLRGSVIDSENEARDPMSQSHNS